MGIIRIHPAYTFVKSKLYKVFFCFLFFEVDSFPTYVIVWLKLLCQRFLEKYWFVWVGLGERWHL